MMFLSLCCVTTLHHWLTASFSSFTYSCF